MTKGFEKALPERKKFTKAHPLVNPEHKGFCTPMTKATCTPRRRAFAERVKREHGFK